MTTAYIKFIEEGKVTDWTYRYVLSVKQNGHTTVIRFKEDSEIMTATFYTQQVIELIVE